MDLAFFIFHPLSKRFSEKEKYRAGILANVWQELVFPNIYRSLWKTKIEQQTTSPLQHEANTKQTFLNEKFINFGKSSPTMK